MKTSNEELKYGYKPTFFDKFWVGLSKIFVKTTRLNNNSRLATEICQNISPKFQVNFGTDKIEFVTGHGRLLWRAKTFHTEEPLMIDWLQGFSKKDTFLDIGANVGTYSIPAAKRASQVIAIELDPNNLFCLHRNVHLNNVHHKVIIVPFAAGTQKSILPIFYRDMSLGDALQSVGKEQSLPTKKPCPFSIRQLVYPIDDIFSDFQLPQPTKIKIDVDGNEADVIGGSLNVIKGAEEIYFEENGSEADQTFLKIILNLGFKIKHSEPCLIGGKKSETAKNLILEKSKSRQIRSENGIDEI